MLFKGAISWFVNGPRDYSGLIYNNPDSGRVDLNELRITKVRRNDRKRNAMPLLKGQMDFLQIRQSSKRTFLIHSLMDSDASFSPIYPTRITTSVSLVDLYFTAIETGLLSERFASIFPDVRS